MPNPPLTPERLGAIVRAARRAQGLRQAQLAGAAGVGQRFLVELERGKRSAHLGKTLSVLAALGCRVEIVPPPAPAREATARRDGPETS